MYDNVTGFPVTLFNYLSTLCYTYQWCNTYAVAHIFRFINYDSLLLSEYLRQMTHGETLTYVYADTDNTI